MSEDLFESVARTGPRMPTKPAAGDIPEEIPREPRWKRPLIVPPGGGVARPYTRASTFGGALEDQYGLGQWRMRMAAWGAAKTPALTMALRSVRDPSGKDKKRLGEIVDSALETAETGAAATIGTAIHAVTETWDEAILLGDPSLAAHLDEEFLGEHWSAFEAYREAMKAVNVILIEAFTVNDKWQAAGTFDRLIELKYPVTAPDGSILPAGTRIIDDLKTSSSSQYFGIKFCVQEVIYRDGELYKIVNGSPIRPGWPDGIEPNENWGLILHVPSGGSTAEWHWVDLRKGRELAQLAYTVRQWRQAKGLVVPADFAPPPTDPLALFREIKACATREELTELWMRNVDSWTNDLTTAASKRLSEIEDVA